MSRLRVALAKEREAKGVGYAAGERRRAKVAEEKKPRLRGGRQLQREVQREAKILHLPMVQPIERPASRGECDGGPRPCPLVGCRYNLFLDAERTTNEDGKPIGAIRITFAGRDPEEMPPGRSCLLDVTSEVEGEGLTVEEVAQILNLTAESVRQIERRAARKMIARLRRLGFTVEDVREALRQAAMDPGRERRRGRHWRPGVQ